MKSDVPSRRLRRPDSLPVALFTTLLLFAPAAPAATPAPFSTFLQENSNVTAIGHDAAGNIYLAGDVFDSPIPGRGGDFFVARLDAGASRIAYLNYFGGSGGDNATAMAVDSEGNAYVAGYTSSPDFPSASQTPPPGPAGRFFPFGISAGRRRILHWR